MAVYIPKEQRKKYQRPDGLFERKVTINGVARHFTGKNISSVNKRIKEYESELAQGIDAGNDKTVGEWARIWMDKYNTRLRPTTYETYRQAYNVHIRPLLASMLLKDVRQINIQDVMNNVARKSEGLQHNVLITMNRIFKTAMQNRIISFNPCAGVSITRNVSKSVTVNEFKALQKKQEDILLKSLTDIKQKIFVGLGLYCGLRSEETLATQWQDIDWDKKRIIIQRTVTHPQNDAVLLSLAKSKAGYRTIPIPAPFLKLLESVNPGRKDTLPIVRHHKNMPDEIIESPFLCPDTKGQPMTKSSYRKFWDKIRAPLSFDLTSHMLRHTYCTMLYNNGIDLRMAQYLMGHSNITVTAKIYTHLSENNLSDASRKINAIFNKKSRKSRGKKAKAPQT